MNHIQIIKRAWKILWSYQALWIFGILLALTGGAYSYGGGGGNGRSSGNNNAGNTSNFTPPKEVQQFIDEFNNGPFYKTLNDVFFHKGTIPADMQQTLIQVAIALCCGLLVLLIVCLFLKYISQAALMRMVDGYENSGEKISWKAGWKLGWSGRAWRMFLIDLVIMLPLSLAFLVLLSLAALPVLPSILNQNTPGAVAIIACVGLTFLVVFLMIVTGVLVSIVKEIILRECALKDAGIRDSLRLGWQAVKRKFTDVFLLWLMLVGLGIGFGLVMIPVTFLLMGLGLLAGGGVGFGVFSLLNATAGQTAAWIGLAAAGGLVFIIVMSLPMLFLNGLYQVFSSSTWTLVYRELHAPPAVAEAALPA